MNARYDKRMKGSTRIDWSAAVLAGMVAGIIATAVQIVLWLAMGREFPAILFRDARLAAAIVVGRAVLTPATAFDASVMLIATLVHFALSAVYGLMLAPIVARLRQSASLAAGAVFGLALYGINLYGFAALFPWFEVARDWITVAAHLVFGVSLAAVYRWCATSASR